MKILVFGNEENFQEFSAKVGGAHDCAFHSEPVSPEGANVIFDFRPMRSRSDLLLIEGCPVIFVNTVLQTLAKNIHHIPGSSSVLVGFNGLKTFFLNGRLEVCTHADKDRDIVKSICSSLQLKYSLIKDQVGMVTPRVIAMIINEAYLTVENKTATQEDVDLAMKLGTNYPYGPFEWCKRIGAVNIVAVLRAMHAETGADQYKTSALLEAELH